mgnify:CR=1 FL=1
MSTTKGQVKQHIMKLTSEGIHHKVILATGETFTTFSDVNKIGLVGEWVKVTYSENTYYDKFKNLKTYQEIKKIQILAD